MRASGDLQLLRLQQPSFARIHRSYPPPRWDADERVRCLARLPQPAQSLLQLQRLHGNHYVQQIVGSDERGAGAQAYKWLQRQHQSETVRPKSTATTAPAGTTEPQTPFQSVYTEKEQPKASSGDFEIVSDADKIVSVGTQVRYAVQQLRPTIISQGASYKLPGAFTTTKPVMCPICACDLCFSRPAPKLDSRPPRSAWRSRGQKRAIMAIAS